MLLLQSRKPSPALKLLQTEGGEVRVCGGHTEDLARFYRSVADLETRGADFRLGFDRSYRGSWLDFSSLRMGASTAFAWTPSLYLPRLCSVPELASFCLLQAGVRVCLQPETHPT